MKIFKNFFGELFMLRFMIILMLTVIFFKSNFIQAKSFQRKSNTNSFIKGHELSYGKTNSYFGGNVFENLNNSFSYNMVFIDKYFANYSGLVNYIFFKSELPDQLIKKNFSIRLPINLRLSSLNYENSQTKTLWGITSGLMVQTGYSYHFKSQNSLDLLRRYTIGVHRIFNENEIKNKIGLEDVFNQISGTGILDENSVLIRFKYYLEKDKVFGNFILSYDQSQIFNKINTAQWIGTKSIELALFEIIDLYTDYLISDAKINNFYPILNFALKAGLLYSFSNMKRHQQHFPFNSGNSFFYHTLSIGFARNF